MVMGAVKWPLKHCS